MLDGLLGRSNFKSKSKSALSRIKARLEVIKKKRNAMQNFLKKDIAELIKTKHDTKAYGRAEGLYIELNLSSCYNYVEECSICVSEHLKEMHKQCECPEECKVAVASLVYTAARFADLPELRDLRIQFYDKYGKALEPFVNKKFAEMLKSKPPRMEIKLQLMQDIAQEFSIKWDPKPLEQQLQNPSKSNNDRQANSNSNEAGRFHRTQSALVVQEMQANFVKDTGGKCTNTAGPKMRHSVSCSVLGTKSQEQHKKNVPRISLSSSGSDIEDNANRKASTNNKFSPAPHTITITNEADKRASQSEDEYYALGSKAKQNGKIDMGKNVDEGSVDGEAKPRPKSVRTKFLKKSYSTVSSSEHQTEVKETMSARAPGEMRYGLLRGENVTGNETNSPRSPTFDLPLPPGRRRYFFPQSQPTSPLRQDGW